MRISEKQLEDIIYESPWIIDERFVIPNIIGKDGLKGRQINIGRSNSKWVDLLFKDTRDNRPIIVELKKGRIDRQSIAQILEYRALLISMNSNDIEIWQKEFGQNYYSPKMILIGNQIDNDAILAANLSGVEVRTFSNDDSSDLGFDSFKELKIKLKEWNSFRKKGNRTLIERGEWVSNIIDIFSRIILKHEGFTTLTKAPELNRYKCYSNSQIPFIDIPVFYKENWFLGFYEYYDSNLPFDDQYIYCDYYFMFDNELDDEANQKLNKSVLNQLKKLNIEFIEYEDNKLPVIKILRSVFESENEIDRTLNLLITFGKKFYDKYITS